MLINTE